MTDKPDESDESDLGSEVPESSYLPFYMIFAITRTRVIEKRLGIEHNPW